MMRKTQQATHGAYSGPKCPACPAVLQPVRPTDLTGAPAGPPSERLGLERHWLVVHPDRPFKQRDAR